MTPQIVKVFSYYFFSLLLLSLELWNVLRIVSTSWPGIKKKKKKKKKHGISPHLPLKFIMGLSTKQTKHL